MNPTLVGDLLAQWLMVILLAGCNLTLVGLLALGVRHFIREWRRKS